MQIRLKLITAAAAGLITALAGCERGDVSSGQTLPVPKQQAATVATDAPTALIFKEPVTPSEWRSYHGRFEAVERLEFLADEQQALDWSLLENVEKLTRFRFDGAADPELAAALSVHHELTLLNVSQSGWNDASAAFIADLTNLTLLRLGSPHLTDASVTAFAKRLTKLRHLHLIGVDISVDSMNAIRDNESIESLYLDGVTVSDEALSELITARPDIHLHIDQLHLKSDPRQD